MNDSSNIDYELLLDYNPQQIQYLDVSKAKSLIQAGVEIDSENSKLFQIFQTGDGYVLTSLNGSKKPLLFPDYEYLTDYLDGNERNRFIVYNHTFYEIKNPLIVSFHGESVIKRLLEKLDGKFHKTIDDHNDLYKLGNGSILKVFLFDQKMYQADIFESFGDYVKSTKTEQRSYEPRYISKYHIEFPRNLPFYVENLEKELDMTPGELDYSIESLENLALTCFKYVKHKSLDDIHVLVLAYLAQTYMNNIKNSRLIMITKNQDKKVSHIPILEDDNGQQYNLINYVSRSFEAMKYYEFYPYTYFYLPVSHN